MRKVKSYVSKFKEKHKKFALEYIDWQKDMAEIGALELNAIKKQLALLEERHANIKI